MKIQVKALMSKMTNDTKKELIQFHVKGDDEKRPELNALCREVVELSITGITETLTCEFSKNTKDSKKTILEFIVKGDTSSSNSFEFYKLSGSDVQLSIVESQMSIDEFQKAKKGSKYTVDGDGSVSVDDEGNENQLELELEPEVEEEENELEEIEG